MPDKIDGTIENMRDLNPVNPHTPIQDGQIFRSRETSAPKRESIFVWDPTPYVGPLYNSGAPDADDEVPQYVGFAPDIDNLRDGSSGLWRWVNPPAGSIDAERVYGISPKTSAVDNGRFLQRCIDEVLASDATWPRPAYDPGEGDSWTVRLPAGTIELDPRDDLNNSIPIAFNRKTARTSGPPNFPQCTYDDERITVAGRIVLEGQGASTTRLVYTGDPANHAFIVGGPAAERHLGGCVFFHYGHFSLRGLALDAATDAGRAVLRLWQITGHNFFENVDVVQRGNGDGINASDMLFSQFIQINVTRQTDESPYAGTLLPYSGRGFWVHTDEDPFFITGSTVLNRLSVFGSFTEGILLGENQGGRLLGAIAGQFINAELCLEGLVVGRGAVNVDFSVLWLEANRVCGARIFDRAKDITLRRIYVLHNDENLPDFEGEVVLGKDPAGAQDEQETREWNSVEGIDLDGVFQHLFVWPAVRVWALPEAAGPAARSRREGTGPLASAT